MAFTFNVSRWCSISKSLAFIAAILTVAYIFNFYQLNRRHPMVLRESLPTKEPVFQKKTRLGYTVLQNYIKAEKWFYGNESVTFTTHSDATFLDNLIPVLSRWQGPLSIAIYAPGSDYEMVLQSIAYYRQCPKEAHLIRNYATFHIFFETKYAPSKIVHFPNVTADCSVAPPSEGYETFKKANKLVYPINVGRNVARESATTHFVLPCDIELYPNPGLIQGFLHMMANSGGEKLISSPNPKVYVVSIFEIEKGHELPRTKAELLESLRREIVIPFHKKYCPLCHAIPGVEKWNESPGTELETHVMEVGKRVGKYVNWEPIYIGTHSDPLYDERLSWDGRSDKMTQAFEMCLMDYDFLILDNAFLIHRPGIKTVKGNPTKPDQKLVRETNAFIKKVIKPDLVKKLPSGPNCH